MLRIFIVSVSIVFFHSNFSLAQKATDEPKTKNKGEFYFTWGYNRDWYSKSNIHIVYRNPSDNQSCDFMIYNAKANDKPDMWRWWYPNRLTIPQYDLNIGYMFNDKNDLGIEIGWNHLKYVVTDWQTAHIKGQINGVPIDKMWRLNPDTIHLQHTNGNNYLMANIVKRKKLIGTKNTQLSAIVKAGVGPMISYTIDTVLGDHDPGYFHYHGWVAGTSVGIRYNFLKKFFVQSDLQGAFANYTNTKLGYSHVGRAYHHFYSLQWTYEIGMRF